jgi:hypothetical protein
MITFLSLALTGFSIYHGGKPKAGRRAARIQVLVDMGQGNASGRQTRPDCGASVCVPSDFDTGRSRSAR